MNCSFGTSDITLQWCDSNYASLTQEQATLTRDLKDVDETDTKRHKGIVKQLQIIQGYLVAILKLRAIRKALADAS